METSKTIVFYAKEFILTYLRDIRHASSMFSSRDWGFFPKYWFHPIKIGIFYNVTDDIAITFGDLAKEKDDRIRIIEWGHRIEESQFPNLNYEEWPFFSVPDGTHHSQLTGGTFSVDEHPLIVLGSGVEFKVMDIRVEARAKGYPREREFVWFFTDPSRTWLTSRERATEDAKYDFWNRIGHVVFTKLADILKRKFASNVADVFLESVKRLRNEYRLLITREDIEEQRLQNFLENHFFIIDPQRSFTKEKRKLGEYYADFILKYNDGSLTLVEIQLNSDPIIENGAPSNGLREAIEQQRSWFEWIKQKEPSKLPDYSGLIIIGHKRSHEDNRQLIQRILSDLNFPIRLITYDDLEKSFDYVENALRRKVSAH